MLELNLKIEEEKKEFIIIRGEKIKRKERVLNLDYNQRKKQNNCCINPTFHKLPRQIRFDTWMDGKLF